LAIKRRLTIVSVTAEGRSKYFAIAVQNPFKSYSVTDLCIDDTRMEALESIQTMTRVGR